MTEKYSQYDLHGLRNPYKVRKKPLSIEAYKITWDDFEVETLEGTMKGRINDWLLIGINGEAYVCKKEIFDKSYDIVYDPTKGNCCD